MPCRTTSKPYLCLLAALYVSFLPCVGAAGEGDSSAGRPTNAAQAAVAMATAVTAVGAVAAALSNGAGAIRSCQLSISFCDEGLFRACSTVGTGRRPWGAVQAAETMTVATESPSTWQVRVPGHRTPRVSHARLA